MTPAQLQAIVRNGTLEVLITAAMTAQMPVKSPLLKRLSVSYNAMGAIQDNLKAGLIKTLTSGGAVPTAEGYEVLQGAIKALKTLNA